MTIRRGAVCAALALAALTSACGGSGGGSSSPAPSAQELTGRHWILDADAVVSGAGSVNSWIRFEDDGRLTGNDGCNAFSGSYRSAGATLTLGPLAGTQMACPGLAGQVGRRVTEALGRVESYAVSGMTLDLRDSRGPALGYHEGRASLDGAWDVTSVLYDDGIRSVIAGTELTARFAANGHLSGSSGCNTFRGRYVVSGDRLSIQPLASTRRACTGPQGAQAQERGYVAALESAVRFEQAGSRLTLFNTKGQMAVTLDRSG